MQANRNSHTTSTKCQYQAQIEAECCVGVKWPASARNRQTIRNRADDDVHAMEAGRHEEGGAVHVAGEVEGGMGVFPALHAGEAQAERDGQRQTPIRPLRLFSSSEWCAQVTVVPEVSRISVLSSGKCQGSKVWMPFGGQTPPVKAIRPTS